MSLKNLPQTLLFPTFLFFFSLAANAEQKLTEQLSLNGLIEIDAILLNQDESEDQLDIVLSTLELGLDVTINNSLNAGILLLSEDEEQIDVDEAFVQMVLENGNSITAGRIYLPFGRFETTMLSDPLTLELGEISDTAVQYDFRIDEKLTAAIFVFNGEVEETGDADDDDLVFGASIDYQVKDFSAGASWVSSLDSDTLGDLPGTVSDTVMGLGLYANWQRDAYTFIVEIIMTMEDFTAGDFANTINDDDRPNATNLEVSYALDAQSMIGASFQTTSEAAFAGLPEQALLLNYSTTKVKDMTLGVEFATTSDYSVADGGANDDSNWLLFRLSTEF